MSSKSSSPSDGASRSASDRARRLRALGIREQGAERVAAHLSESCLSAVNLAEVIGRFVRDGHDAHEVLARLAASETELVPFTPEQAAIAAQLIPGPRASGAARRTS